MPGRSPTRGTSLLVKVRSRASIHARRKVRGILEGEYGSVHKGRSMEFDDLREYVPGDDVKDIDWKATARSGQPLIKRFVATRQHAVLLVVDTGRAMAAMSDADSTKRDVAVMAAGVIGQLVLRHHDLVGLLAGPLHPDDAADAADRAPVIQVRCSQGEAHLERILRVIHDSIDADGDPSCLDLLLDEAARRTKRRMIVVVVAGDTHIDASQEARLKRLRAQHEVLFCTVGDLAVAAPSDNREACNIETGRRLPAYLRRNGALRDDLAELARRRDRATIDTLNRLGIIGTRLTGESNVVPAVIAMLERQRGRR